MPDNEEKLVLSADETRLVAGVKRAAQALRELDQLTSLTNRELDKAETVIRKVGNSLDKLASSSTRSTRGIDNNVSSLRKWSSEAKDTITQLQRLENAQHKLSDRALAGSSLPSSLQGRLANGTFAPAGVTGLTLAQNKEIARVYELQSQTLQQVNANEIRRKEALEQSVREARELARIEAQVDRNPGATSSLDPERLRRQAVGLPVAVDPGAARGLSTIRYSLYDVSTALAVVGAGLIGITALTYGAAIAFERNFANVIRTSQVTGENIDTLRGNFIALQQDIPVSSADLANIGTLGSQLGIAASELTGFVRVAAQFSAASGLSVEDTTTAFGRLDELLPDVQGNFEALASSILLTGVNSVATEAQIVKVTQQIASMGNLAGLSAPEVIGLASALSSLGIPPELARGVITSSFTRIITAVSAGGPAVEKFGSVLGLSGEQFQKAWNEDAIGTFESLLKTIAGQGDGAVGTLIDLGLASQRLTPTLLKLGQNTEVLDKALSDARIGFEQSAELARQYDITAGTLSSKIAVLKNNFEALLVTLGGNGGIFGGLIDGAIEALKVLTAMASNPFWNVVGQGSILLGGLVGVFALLGSGVARTAASLIAVGQAFGIETVAANGAAISTATLKTELIGMGAAGRVAAAGINLASVALKTLGLAALVFAGFEIFKGVSTAAQNLTTGIIGIDNSTAGAVERMKELGYASAFTGNGFNNWLISADRQAANLGITTTGLGADLKRVDTYLTELFQSGQSSTALATLEEISDAQNVSIDTVLQNLPDARAQYELYNSTLNETQKATDLEAAAAESAAAQFEKLAASIGLVPEELSHLAENLLKGSEGFFDYGQIVDGLRTQLEDTAKAAEDSGDAVAIEQANAALAAGVSAQSFNAALESQIAAQTAWADNLQILTARGATGFVTELAKIGPEGASVAASAVNMTTEELNKLEQNARLAAFLSSQAFIDEFITNTPELIEAYRTGGIAAVQALIAGVETGKPAAVNSLTSINDTAARYFTDHPIAAKIKDEEARKRMEALISHYNNTNVSLRVNLVAGSGLSLSPDIRVAVAKGGQIDASGLRAFAKGGQYGQFRGPGTGTSDSILARVSNGEYIHTAATARYYGKDYMDALNRRQIPRYAQGGPVAGSSPVDFPAAMNWGPAERDLLRQIVANTANNGLPSDEWVAGAANRGNAKFARQGRK